MRALRKLREGGAPPKKTQKFTKKAGKKREFNMSGWTQEEIVFYEKTGIDGRVCHKRTKMDVGRSWRQNGLCTLKITNGQIATVLIERGNGMIGFALKTCLPYR